jgi:hypothetical protein
MHHHPSPQSCASCGKLDCSMSYASQKKIMKHAKTCYLLDDVWQEYTDYIRQHLQPDDDIVSLGICGKAIPSRYAWQLPNTTHIATIDTFLRHIHMHRVRHSSGAIRQHAYLRADKAIAHTFAKHIDYHANHLVIQQNFLPHLASLGTLGGRTYDVLMTRYPMRMIHEKLDAIAQKHPESTTIKDFRADAQLVATEWDALSNARDIITPHHDIARIFPKNTLLLPWHTPPIRPRKTGTRTAFLGSTLTRHGADIAKHIAQFLPEPLIVFGEQHTHDTLWKGIAIEVRTFSNTWMDELGTILFPSSLCNQPRKLLQAHAQGIAIHATASCGLAATDYSDICQHWHMEI